MDLNDFICKLGAADMVNVVIDGGLSLEISFERPFCSENGESFEIYAGNHRLELSYDIITDWYQDGETDFFVLNNGLTVGVSCF